MPRITKPKEKNITSAMAGLQAAIAEVRKPPPEEWGEVASESEIANVLNRNRGGVFSEKMKKFSKDGLVRAGRYFHGDRMRQVYCVKDITKLIKEGYEL